MAASRQPRVGELAGAACWLGWRTMPACSHSATCSPSSHVADGPAAGGGHAGQLRLGWPGQLHAGAAVPADLVRGGLPVPREVQQPAGPLPGAAAGVPGRLGPERRDGLVCADEAEDDDDGEGAEEDQGGGGLRAPPPCGMRPGHEPPGHRRTRSGIDRPRRDLGRRSRTKLAVSQPAQQRQVRYQPPATQTVTPSGSTSMRQSSRATAPVDGQRVPSSDRPALAYPKSMVLGGDLDDRPRPGGQRLAAQATHARRPARAGTATAAR